MGTIPWTSRGAGLAPGHLQPWAASAPHLESHFRLREAARPPGNEHRTRDHTSDRDIRGAYGENMDVTRLRTRLHVSVLVSDAAQYLAGEDSPGRIN